MTTHVVQSTASNLAGPGFPTATFIPAPSATSTVKGAHPAVPGRRPNRGDLELILLRAQVRTHQRRLRESLGVGLPSGVAQRSTRVVAQSFPQSSTPNSPPPLSYSPTPSTTTTTTTATDTDNALESPITHTPLPLPVPSAQSGRHFPEAPSPSFLPTPTFGSPAPAPPAYPHLVQSRPQYGSTREQMGRNHSFVTHGDPALTPRHVVPANLRLTPGAPVWADDDATSYFRAPLGVGRSGPNVGLGITTMEIDVELEDGVYWERYCFDTAAL